MSRYPVGAVPVILLADRGQIPERTARRLAARARDVLLVAGTTWPAAHTHLRVTAAASEGVGQGHGLLTRRRARHQPQASGTPPSRSAAARPDRAAAPITEEDPGLRRIG